MSDPLPPLASPASAVPRIDSIDALRGLVMFAMIFVNDIAGANEQVVPRWMQHYHGKNGMTFVDLVFPAFLFIVGMSIPFAIASRRRKGEPVWQTLLHIVARTASLILIGILMVNETPSTKAMGWSGALWSTLMYGSAILAFLHLRRPGKAKADVPKGKTLARASLGLRLLGFASLAFLAFAFRGEKGHRIITLSPFSIHHSWYGILGLIGWAYLVGAVVYLVFRERRTALLGCAVLLMCLYPAARKGTFEHFWLNDIVSLGETLGSQAAITVAGVLLASILVTPETSGAAPRVRFTLWFVAGCSAGAMLLYRLYGISKNNATPSWCLWACAVTAALWLLLYLFVDVSPVRVLGRPLVIAGRNVLLAYLLSEMLPSILEVAHLDKWYDGLADASLNQAVGRSAGCAAVLLTLTAILNRLGFGLKL